MLHPKLIDVIDRLDSPILSNQKMNLYLKTIADQLEWNKNITFHSSRHTGAILFLNRGGSMAVLSRLLSHASITTTEIYGKIINSYADSEIKKVFG